MLFAVPSSHGTSPEGGIEPEWAWNAQDVKCSDRPQNPAPQAGPEPADELMIKHRERATEPTKRSADVTYWGYGLTAFIAEPRGHARPDLEQWRTHVMKAFVIPQPGVQAVELADVPVPMIDDEELLVRVCAVGVGIHDSSFLPADAHYPYPIGIEAAGVIEQTGRGVSGYRPGDRAAFVSSMQPKGGTWAQFVAVNAGSLIIPVPAGMDSPEAAAVPVAGNTILRAFRVLEPMPAGGTLFIAGGSGAIGTLAIQIARRHGWRVAASASAPNHAYMLSLGAEKTVDYHDPNWGEQVLQWMPAGVDAVLAVQPGTSSQSLQVLKDAGALVTISGDALVSERGVRMSGVPYPMDVRDELVQLMTDIAEGALRVELERVYPFEQALAALAKVQTRSARGKHVLRLEQ